MPPLPLRAALIGYGLAGRVFHAPFLTPDRGFELAVVVTAHPERQEQARTRHPRAAVVATVDEAWAHRPDLVVVAAPNSAHAALARAAIDRGLPVVVDKPLATSAAEARALAEEAARAGVPLVPFHNRRWDGDVLTLRRLFADGRLGEVHRFESRFERWRPQIREGWREDPAPEAGGGVLLDLGTHLVDQALWLFGPVTGLHAEVDARRRGARTSDDVFLALTHASGVRSHLWASATAAHTGPRLRVLGRRAAYVKHGLDPQEPRLRGDDPPPEHGELVAGDAREPLATEPGDYGRFYTALQDTLRRGAPPPVSVLDAIAVLEILDAAAQFVLAPAPCMPSAESVLPET